MVGGLSTMPKLDLSENQQTIFLVEYQKAVDSVQHFDTLQWAFVGLISAGIAGLVGLAIQPGYRPIVRLSIAVAGLLLSILLPVFMTGFINMSEIARERSLELEGKLGMQLQLNIKAQYPVPIIGMKIRQRTIIYVLSFVACVGWAVFFGYLLPHSCSSASAAVQGQCPY
jgi:hypothetical protein